MNKHLIVFGLVILLLVVGFSGCNELDNSNGIGNTSGVEEIGLTIIGDLSANPEEYLGKEVMVKGRISSLTGNYGTIGDGSGHWIWVKTDKELQGWLNITGIIEYGKLYTGYGEGYYLNISSAKTD
jgi:hypothetical protein